LLRATLSRLEPIVPRSRICTVVSAYHRLWWRNEIWSLPASNVLVQPQARGTGIGLLLGLLIIEQRNPEAVVLSVPSDHYVGRPDILVNAMDDALIAATAHDSVVMLGIEPETLDPEFGYLSLGASNHYGVYEVAEFLERPADLQLRAGSERLLWNTFIFADTCEALLNLYDLRFPEIVTRLRTALGRRDGSGDHGDDFAALFEELPTIDFSADVLTHSAAHLRALIVPDCGLSDLGTPARVAETLRRAGPQGCDAIDAPVSRPDLAYAVRGQMQQGPAH
jgi:mannose-1-phosphate guanylyltransferase